MRLLYSRNIIDARSDPFFSNCCCVFSSRPPALPKSSTECMFSPSFSFCSTYVSFLSHSLISIFSCTFSRISISWRSRRQFFNHETQHHTLPSHCLLARNNIIFWPLSSSNANSNGSQLPSTVLWDSSILTPYTQECILPVFFRARPRHLQQAFLPTTAEWSTIIYMTCFWTSPRQLFDIVFSLTTHQSLMPSTGFWSTRSFLVTAFPYRHWFQGHIRVSFSQKPIVAVALVTHSRWAMGPELCVRRNRGWCVNMATSVAQEIVAQEMGG